MKVNIKGLIFEFPDQRPDKPIRELIYHGSAVSALRTLGFKVKGQYQGENYSLLDEPNAWEVILHPEDYETIRQNILKLCEQVNESREMWCYHLINNESSYPISVALNGGQTVLHIIHTSHRTVNGPINFVEYDNNRFDVIVQVSTLTGLSLLFRCKMHEREVRYWLMVGTVVDHARFASLLKAEKSAEKLGKYYV